MMKKINSPKFVLFLALILTSAFVCTTQGQQSPPDAAKRPAQPAGIAEQDTNQSPPKPINLLQLLNLTTDQLQQIRAINQETRENVRAANMKLRDARRALDAAIYADAPSQSEVADRARQLGQAQTEAIQVRADVELRIRQILTTEQLIRFRDLRRQFEQKLKDQLQLQKKSLRQLNNKPL